MCLSIIDNDGVIRLIREWQWSDLTAPLISSNGQSDYIRDKLNFYATYQK